MNNADRQVLSAIAKNPHPLETSVPMLAGIVTSLGQEIEELKARLAEKPSREEKPAHELVLPGIPSGDGKTLYHCTCGLPSGWGTAAEGIDAIQGHIARELYGYVPGCELEAAVEPSPRPFLSNTATDEAVQS